MNPRLAEREIHQNVTEGQKLFRPDKKAKQVFYYDDFLGQTSTGEKLGKNEDRALLQLIKSVARTGNKRFILTTREYILAQAKVDFHQFVVSCDDYSDLDKARFLANHLYFAQVSQDHIAALVEERNSSQLIVSCHNPSILDFLDQRVSAHVDEAIDMLRYAVFFEQVQRLFQVFDVGGTRKRGKDKQSLDARVVEEAIESTLLSRSIRHVQSSQGTGKWHRSSTSIWERLMLCCRIGSMIQDRQLHNSIDDHIDAHLSEIVQHPGELADILPLCDVVDTSKWIRRTLVECWRQQMWTMLLKLESDFEESLEGLSVLAQWFVDSRDRFDTAQAETFEENLATAITHEVEYNSDHSDPERLGGDLATVEEIAKTLKREFEDEIKWLNESLGECGRPDGEDGAAWVRHRAASCTSSIESLFDALIE